MWPGQLGGSAVLAEVWRTDARWRSRLARGSRGDRRAQRRAPTLL